MRSAERWRSLSLLPVLGCGSCWCAMVCIGAMPTMPLHQVAACSPRGDLARARCLPSRSLRGAVLCKASASEREQGGVRIRKMLERIAPRYDGASHKGQGGKIAIFGGCKDFSGAPYFAGQAAMNAGAELVHVYTTAEEALVPIKCYSPDLMVSMPSSVAERVRQNRLHAICAGPGLGQVEAKEQQSGVLNVDFAMRELVCIEDIPIILDADAVKWAACNPDTLRGRSNIVLTPNAPEFSRLAEAVLGRDVAGGSAGDDNGDDLKRLVKELQGPTIVLKGPADRISSAACPVPHVVDLHGSTKRPGGLGDVLAGSTTLLVSWAWKQCKGNAPIEDACECAATLVRLACRLAQARKGRSMTASDVLEHIGPAFDAMLAE